MSVDGIISVVQMGVYLVLAVNLFSSCIQDPRERIAGFTGLLLSTGFLSVLAVATRQSYPLGIHKNAVGANLAYGLIVCTELMLAARSVWRKRLLRVLALVLIGGLFFSLSRGAWISAVLGVAIVMGMRKEFGLFLRGSVVTGVVIAMAWAVLPKHEQLYAVDMSPRTNSVNARLVSIDYAMHYFETSPLLGVGVGLRKEYDATNIVMSTLAETGVIGLITFGSIFLSLIWKVFNSRKHIQVRQSEFSFVVVGTALVMVELAHGVVDHYWVRGMLPVWAAVGLAIQSVDRCRRECARQY
jgi:O-antigen ligase